MKLTFLTFFVLLLIGSCNHEEALPKPEVYKIREIGELSSTEYVFSKVIRIDDPAEWYKFGDRKILLSCKAKVKAGVDLRLLMDEDISANGSQINVVLPQSRITSFNMDPNSVKVEVVDVDGFRSNFSQNDINDILKLGEKSIRDAMVETGIYQEAEKNAITFVKEFYQQLGYTEVYVSNKRDHEK